MPDNEDDIQKWALLGIEREIERLNALRQQLVFRDDGATNASAETAKSRGHVMTPAQRRAHSKRMKAFWAAKRAAAAKTTK